ncbi:hypothetical protein HPB52_008939 [Rhipicephalus sanguineus]|uniref:Uncharacterized protein n=1 Tax=Rhipicephalus sanguineus TaxID=34632 RepID=A0A9D4PYX7_RHISA|nr:hypothetical protein HPB52_008939 [Rhipicephalus sanguineus]
MSTAEFTALALRIGLEGTESKAWVEEREARARDERAAEREAKKEQMEMQRQLEEQSQRTLQLRLQLAATENTRESAVADIARRWRQLRDEETKKKLECGARY